MLAVAAVAVVGTATPLIALRVAPAGTFTAVPDYWRQTASWLAGQHDTGRALVVPGSRFGQYVWGTPMDEPLQPLAGSAWDVRNAIPLTDTGHIRLLDSLDDQFASGQPSAGLAAVLARSGIRYLVVRNDLDYGQAQSTRPVLVHQVLAGSPGLNLVAELRSAGGRWRQLRGRAGCQPAAALPGRRGLVGGRLRRGPHLDGGPIRHGAGQRRPGIPAGAVGRRVARRPARPC